MTIPFWMTIPLMTSSAAAAAAKDECLGADGQ
jgi:hypothetical protein